MAVNLLDSDDSEEAKFQLLKIAYSERSDDFVYYPLSELAILKSKNPLPVLQLAVLECDWDVNEEFIDFEEVSDSHESCL